MISFVFRYGLALTLSLLAIVYAVMANVPVYFVVLLIVSYVAWGLAAYRRYRAAVRQVVEPHSMVAKEEKVMEQYHFSDVEKYHFRLLISLNESSQMLMIHIANILSMLRRMDDRVEQAKDLAKNTELLAVNAMMSAARTGEVGRGFVSVSKDLIGISERADSDLKRLENLIHGLMNVLVNVDFLPKNAALAWVNAEMECSDFSLTSRRCSSLRTSIKGCLRILDELYEKYESTSQLDVRWLQLGEAVRRVISSLRDALRSLLGIADNLTSDVQLLSLSEHLERHQLVEIHKGFLQFVAQQDKMNEIIS